MPTGRGELRAGTAGNARRVLLSKQNQGEESWPNASAGRAVFRRDIIRLRGGVAERDKNTVFSRARWRFRQRAWPARRRARKECRRARENAAKEIALRADRGERISDLKLEI